MKCILYLVLSAVCPFAFLSGTRQETAPPRHAKRGQTWVDPRTGIAFCYVPAGNFVVGSTESAVKRVRELAQLPLDGAGIGWGESPPRVVMLPAYWISRTEVTNDQYARFLAAERARAVPANNVLQKQAYADYAWDPRRRKPPAGRGKHPVVNVRLEDARAYARWAACRLPSEAEWEKAAGWNPEPWSGEDPDAPSLLDWTNSTWKWSAGLPRVYPWGNDWHWWLNCAEYQYQGCLPTHYEWVSKWVEPTRRLFGSGIAFKELRRVAGSWIRAVGTFPQDRSMYGCLDMAGNVTEICSTESGSNQNWILRGGHFDSPWWECRITARMSAPVPPALKVGFRCVYLPKTVPERQQN